MSDAQRRAKALEARRTGLLDAWLSTGIRKGLTLGGKPFPSVPAGAGDSFLVFVDGAWTLMPLPVDEDGRLKITLDARSRRLLEELVLAVAGGTDKRGRKPRRKT